MKREILINAGPRETRVAILEDAKLVELLVDRPDNRRMVGDIYLGRVEAVLPGIQAAFVDIGTEKSAFLHASDLVRESAEEAEDEDDDDEEDDRSIRPSLDAAPTPARIGGSNGGGRRRREERPADSGCAEARAGDHGSDLQGTHLDEGPARNRSDLPRWPIPRLHTGFRRAWA